MMFLSCEKEESTTEPSGLKVGETDNVSIYKGEKLIIQHERTIINFGTDAYPCLIPITTKHEVKDPVYSSAMIPVSEDEIRTFVLDTWAPLFDIDILNEMGRISAFINFTNYIISNNINMAIFVKHKRTDVKKIVMMNETKGIDINKTMQLVSDGHATYNELLFALSDVASIETRETAAILKIMRNGVEIVDEIINLVVGESVMDINTTKGSVLSSNDTNENNYSAGQAVSSSEYYVHYNMSKYKFKIEANIKSKHNVLGGTYIKNIHVNTLTAKTGAGKLIVNMSYSSPINVGSTIENPVAKIISAISVQYGDCCLVQKYFNLNVKILAESGISTY